MSDVFISFIHEEKGYAEAVKEFLTRIFESNVTPFMSSDQFQVYAGENWLERIMGELKTAKVVILMVSRRSVSRPWVNFEAGAVWMKGIPIIPVCYGRLSVDDLPKPYSSLQAVNLDVYGDDEYFARSVAHHLGIEEPMTHVEALLLSFGDDEYKKKCKIVEAAYTGLQNELFDLNEKMKESSESP